MGDNYYYIITGLPFLLSDFENQKIDYDSIKEQIYEELSSKDRRLVDWLEFGLNTNNISSHFYNAVKTSKSNFISNYFSFDRSFRNTQVEYLSKKLGKSSEAYTVGVVNENFEEKSKVISALEEKNILDKEMKSDLIRWNKINELTVFEYFSIDVILAFLTKAKIIQRWSIMNKETGSEFFKKLVDEVRGTFSKEDIKDLK